MQSSLWKLLTAAGIIGIGTLVVLEVQSRLPIRSTSTNNATVKATGNDISITPDASTPFDEELLARNELSDGTGDPSSFDRPGTGPGSPAPPADDSRFYGAAEDRTVNKDELTDNESPFAVSMDEPAEVAVAENVTTNQDGSLSSLFVDDKAAEESAAEPSVKPASFQPKSSATRDTAPKSAASAARPPSRQNSTPVNDEPMIAFPSKVPKQAPVSAPTPAASETKSVAKNALMFFPIGANATNKPAAPVPSPAASSQPAAEKTLQQTAATFDEPVIEFPEPVPDLSQPNPLPALGNDETPTLDALPFGEDDTPARREPVRRPATRPAATGEPSDSTSNGNFFGEDGTDAPVKPLPVADAPADESETLPFMPDESIDEEPRRNNPIDNAFPRPEFPNRNPGAGTDLSRPNETVPFEPDDSDVPRTEPRPLPSAEELPTRPGRSGASSTRTVSETMQPRLTIQKQAPGTATVGVSHDYTIVVTNEGSTPAYDVVVEDELGGAADFVESKPVAEYNKPAGELVWNFRELKANEKKEIRVRIRPTGEGTLDGVATVRFKAQVKSATVITAPKLELLLTGPEEVKVGDEVQLTYTIRNRGSGDAANVVLRSVLPPGLKHPEGGDLEYEIENLRSGEKEDIDLTVIAAEPGELILVSAEVTSSGVSAAKARTEIEIVGAQLTLERLGPERRYVGRSATYQNIVTNESKFEATNAVVVEEVPEGMRFVSASNGGEYNPDNHRIRWTIPRIGAGKQALLEVELMAEESGQMETMVEVTENAGFRTPLTENTIVTVEDLHNVTADISRQDEPVAIGARFGFTVTIDNRGTAVARNVQMSVEVPKELKILAAGTRDVPGKLFPGNVVEYNKVLEIQPNEQMTFQLTLQGEKAVRNARVQAYLKYDEMQDALIVSESVTVYDDRP